jgi:hypothetical protein
MGMTLHSLGLVRRLSSHSDPLGKHLFRICADFPAFGPFVITWKDEEGINYVASVNVRMELDAAYDNVMNLTQEHLVAENSISEKVGEEDESEEWM